MADQARKPNDTELENPLPDIVSADGEGSEPLDPIPVEQPTNPASGDKALLAKVDQLQRQVADYKGLVADFENSRKRLAADYDRQRKYAIEPLASDLLTGLDNLNRALEAARASGDNSPLTQGVMATTALFLDILKRHGVTKIEATPGTEFDPNRHEAVMQQPSLQHQPGQVAMVLQEGYMLHDRVIRPTKVAVASEPADATPEAGS